MSAAATLMADTTTGFNLITQLHFFYTTHTHQLGDVHTIDKANKKFNSAISSVQ